MLNTETTIINGREWSVTQFPGTKALDAVHMLAGAIGSGLKGVVLSGGKVSLDSEVNIADIISGILSNLGSPKETESKLLRLLRHTRIDGEPILKASDFDSLFAGPAFFDIVPGIKFVLQVNFGGFFRTAESFIDLSGEKKQDEVRKD